MTRQTLPQGGGSYSRDDKGKLKQAQTPTKPAQPGKPAAAKSTAKPATQEGSE